LKRSISYLLALAMLFSLITPVSAEIETIGEITTEPMLLTVDSVMSLYNGEDADTLREFLITCLPEYEANGTSQEFLLRISEKIRTEEKFDIIDIMNVRQVMAGLPEGSLPIAEPEEEEILPLSTDGEIRLKAGGINPKIDIGQEHTIYLKEDGTVITWGKYYSGDRYIAVNDSGIGLDMTTLTGIVDVSAGGGSALALKSDGTVWAWGANEYGQLGDNSTTDRTTPVQVSTANGYLTNVAAISMGDTNAVAITADGAVYAWGDNTYGQLGNGTTTSSLVATRVSGVDGDGYLSHIKAISVGGSHVLALCYDNTVLSWGKGGDGQLGLGSVENKLTPTIINLNDLPLSDIKKISAGGKHSLALTKTGTVYAWGANNKGQLGIGSTTSSFVPVFVSDISGNENLGFVTDIAAGYEFSAARRSDGTVCGWGANNKAQLGDGTIMNKGLPAQSNITMAAEVFAGKEHLVVKKADGTVWGVGANNVYQLGDPYPSNRSKNWLWLYTPMGETVDIGSSALTSIVVASNGIVYTSGVNSTGQIGDGTTEAKQYPAIVRSPDGTGKLENIIKAKQGGAMFAIRGDGTLWAWGYTETVDEVTTNITLPVQVRDSSGEYITNVADFDTGSAKVIKGDGSVWEWNNGIMTAAEPTEETTVADALQVEGNLMLKYDGTVWARGSNEYGQLGIGQNTSYTTEDWVQVKGYNGNGYLTNIVQISSKLTNTALAADGTVYTWGNNQYGTCGNKSTNNQNVPTKVKGVGGSGYLSGIVKIAGFTTHTFAFMSDGELIAWGSNWDGQMGGGPTKTQSTYPSEVFRNGEYKLDDFLNAYTLDAYEVPENRWVYARRERNGDTDFFTFVHNGDGEVFLEVEWIGHPTGNTVGHMFQYDAELEDFDQLTATTYRHFPVEAGNRYYIMVYCAGYNTFYRFRLSTATEALPDETVDEYDDGNGDNFGDGTGDVEGDDFNDPNYGSAISDVTFSHSQNITTVADEEYSFILTANNVSGVPVSMTFEYDSTYFDIVTLCGLVSEPKTTTGTVNGTGIAITEVSGGTITFTRNLSVTEGMSWNGAVNIIRLKAKKSGTTVVSCETGGAQ